MKKILSVLLAVLLLGACLIPAFAAADEGYTQIYTVRVASAYAKMIEIEPVGEDNTVKQGDSFRFAVKYLGSYLPDVSTKIKAYPASYPHDLYFRDDDTTECYTLTCDELGIYTIENVQEDMYIVALSLQEKQFSNLKDMLFSFLNSILEFFRKIFKMG